MDSLPQEERGRYSKGPQRLGIGSASATTRWCGAETVEGFRRHSVPRIDPPLN